MDRDSDNVKRKFWPRVLGVLVLLVCLTLFVSGLLLKRGIELDHFTSGPVTVSDFLLQWQEKLELQIGTITVEELGGSGFSKNFNLIDKGIRAAGFLSNFFSDFSVKTIRIRDFNGSVYLHEGEEPSFFNIESDDLIVRSTLVLKKNSLVVHIDQLSSKRFKSEAEGEIHLGGGKNHVSGTLRVNLAGVLPVLLDFTANGEQVSFSGKEAGVIRDITPFVDLFGFDNNIQRWITGYLKGSRYRLKTFAGSIPWNDPASGLNSLYAEGRVDDLEYTFAPGDPGLEPVKAAYGDVIFSRGVLTIVPFDSTFHGREIREGSVEIDFTRPADIILTTYIKARTRADGDILSLLEHYGITLPFKQKAGEVKVDIVLTVNLKKRRVEVSGIFLIDKGIIEYGGKNYGVRDTRIVLKNSNVNIDGVVSLEKLFVAGISGTFDSKVGMGDLEITLDQISFETGKSRVTLDRTATKPVINYHIRPEGDILDAGGSSWNLDSLQLTLGSFSGPFSTKDLAITLPPTPLTISPGISTRIAGSLSFAAKKFDIHCDILKYQKADLVLEEAGLPISIQFDKELTITTEKQSRWRVNNVLTTLYPSKFRYGNDTLSMVNGRISYGDLFDSQISGHFNNLSKKGAFILGDLHIKKKNISELFGASTDIPVEVSLINDRLVITVPELALSISTAENKGWSATFHDLAAVHQRVRMWKEYLPDSGSLAISSKDGGQPYSFSADIPYQYHFLVKNNTPVTDLHISGEITGDGIHATVNEALQVQLNDHLAVTSKGVDFNLPEIISFLKDRSSTPTGNQEKNKSIKYTVDVEDSSLFLKPGSEILADRLHIDNMGGKTILRLEYGSGYINVDLKGNTFTIEGENLDHTFMSALAEDAQFENGKMSLAGRGNLDKFSILFKIEDTTLKKLKTLQNILAFANTVPALITFSLPEFDTRGLPVSSAVFGMVVEEGVATVESFDMKSSELNMSGNGIIDFPGKRIDMELNLITQARRNIKKIPLVGYILAGDDKRALVTLHISGNLHDPEVENSMLQQAVTLPFAVLLRTLALPAHLAGFMSDSGNGKKNKENDSESGEINELESGGDK